MCNVCNSNVYIRSGCRLGGSTWNNGGCGCNSCGWGNFWNSGYQSICRDGCGNIRVNQRNGNACSYNSCNWNTYGTSTQNNGTDSNAFVCGCQRVSNASATGCNGDAYYARLYGLTNTTNTTNTTNATNAYGYGCSCGYGCGTCFGCCRNGSGYNWTVEDATDNV